jgi:hypothetical protein
VEEGRRIMGWQSGRSAAQQHRDFSPLIYRILPREFPFNE